MYMFMHAQGQGLMHAYGYDVCMLECIHTQGVRGGGGDREGESGKHATDLMGMFFSFSVYFFVVWCSWPHDLLPLPLSPSRFPPLARALCGARR